MMLKDKISFYKVCFDSMQVGILVCDANKEIVLVNNPISEIFGYTTQELLENNVDILFKNSTLFNGFIENSQNEKFKSPIEFLGLAKNGSEIPIELTFGKIEYETKHYYKALITNISLRKQEELKINDLNFELEEKIKSKTEELEKMVVQLKKSLEREKELNHHKTKFISLASHEFKTPLTAILTSTELIVKYTDLQKFNKRDEHVAKIKTMIHHLNATLNDFLTLENIELGKIIPNYSLFKCSELVEEIIQYTKPFLKKGQTLKFKNNVNDIIYQDPKILKIIINNLLYNAIKYSGEDGCIKVNIHANESTLFFSVKDYGIGIPQNEQEFIFNRFYRAKNTVNHSGTGIGLNIVKGYVKSLEGEISFKSVENKGTVFNVHLPKINNHKKKGLIL